MFFAFGIGQILQSLFICPQAVITNRRCCRFGFSDIKAADILRAGIAFGGTAVTGNALRLRFELPDLAERAGEGGVAEADAPRPAVLLDRSAEADDAYVTIGGDLS